MSETPQYKQFFSDILSEGKQCAMAAVTPFNGLMDFIKSIPDSVVYEPGNPDYGREMHPHVTILYGIEDVSEERAKQILTGLNKKINIQLGKISMFNNPQFDVLKIEVKSQDLMQLNKLLTKSVKYTNDHPDYIPHLTLAYLKKGQAAQYVGDDRFEGMNLQLDTIAYSDGNNTVNIPIKGGIHEYGAGGGYGGQVGGPAAPSGWADTQTPKMGGPSSSRRSTYMQGNTIVSAEPYGSVDDKDLEHPKFSKAQIFSGLRYEMKRMEFPNKDEAKAIVLKNLQKDPNFYTSLSMYFNSDKL